MKKVLLTILVCFILKAASSQSGAGYQKSYHFLKSGNLVADKNFYLLTVIKYTPSIKKILAKEEKLNEVLNARKLLITKHASDTCSLPVSLVTAFKYSESDSLLLDEIFKDLYSKNKLVFDELINKHLRPSGYYQRFVGLSNEALLCRAWGQYVVGINYIIDQFGLGKKMRYPRIDSASYVVTSRYYRMALKDMFAYLSESTDSMEYFFQPSLAVALQLMELNDRDEPARFEPMETGANKKAIEKIKTTLFNKYRFACIVIPGNGPELTTTPLSPINKMHCDIAASRFKKGWAPFIIVSGGYCYPFQGPFCEAVEMKKYLMAKHGISESVIIIDPHARHTTTNMRNANRLMIRYGIPITQLSVFITTQSQTNMVTTLAGRNFDTRNKEELGYLPYANKQRIDLHCVSFYPTIESLHMDPFDPLDP